MNILTGIIIIIGVTSIVYLIVPWFILKIEGPTEGRNKEEEFGFIMIKIGYIFSGLMLITLIIRLLRGILT